MPSDPEPSTTHPNPQRSEPALCCWFCGYELFASDLPSQNFACPECGKINLPHDANCSPYIKRRWPHPILTLLMMVWPGLFVGLLICVTIRLETVVGAIVGLLVLPQCLLWPISITDSMLHLRVPGMSRKTSHRLFLFGGIILNFALCGIVPWLFIRLGGI